MRHSQQARYRSHLLHVSTSRRKTLHDMRQIRRWEMSTPGPLSAHTLERPETILRVGIPHECHQQRHEEYVEVISLSV